MRCGFISLTGGPRGYGESLVSKLHHRAPGVTARQQIVVAATRLFYDEAIRAVPPDSHPKTWVVRRSMGTRYGF
jgi:hypothetical protein